MSSCRISWHLAEHEYASSSNFGFKEYDAKRPEQRIRNDMISLNKLFEIDKTGKLRYGVSLPAEYGSRTEESWPVIVFLHGYRECGQPADSELCTEVLLTRHGPLKDGNPLSATNEFIVVVPQLPCSQSVGERGFDDNWIEYAETVKQIVNTVQKEYKGDSKRTYLTGFSYGGNGVFDLAFVQPDFWAALWPVDPPRVPEAKPCCPIWLFTRAPDKLNLQKVKTGEPIPKSDFLYTHSTKDHSGTSALAYGYDLVYEWLKGKHLLRPGHEP